MGKLTFILGGARSGKSRFANGLAAKHKSVLYIATYRRCAGDREMEERVKKHKENRPRTWKVIEEPVDLCSVIKKYGGKYKVVLIDCITLWVSNLMLSGKNSGGINLSVCKLANAVKKVCPVSILVSNEVGLGVVPDTKMGRNFRDIAGSVNQAIAQSADAVYFMIAGIPLVIKELK